MSFLRYLMLLSLVAWIGGLIFFAFVLAPTAFQVLPTTHLAGNVVGRVHRQPVDREPASGVSGITLQHNVAGRCPMEAAIAQ